MLITFDSSLRGPPLLLRCFTVLAATGLIAAGPALAGEPEPIVIEHVNVVPMDRERVLRDQTVSVEDGTIRAVGKRVARPANARVIDGRGKWLSPGLADMHVHSTTSRDMAVLLATGVTTVLNMGGARTEFVGQVVPRLNRGDRPGPHVYVALRVDGTPEYGQLVVTSPEQARAVVGLAKTNGYDFIKVYNNLAPDVFDAFVTEGKRQGIPVVGHGVTLVGIERQLAAGQMMVAHLEEYLYTAFFPPSANVGNRAPRLDQISRAVAFTKRSGAYVTADLNTYATIARQWGRPDVVSSFLAMPTVRYLDPDDRIGWKAEGYAARSGSLDERLAFLASFAKALADAGVPLLAGTDAPSIPGLVPGYALHQDLQALVGAGLSRFQALSTATRTPGQFIAAAKPGSQCFGVIMAGCRADLILTADNPLHNLETLDRPLGVMVIGRWHDAEGLQTLLDGVARKYEAATSEPSKPRSLIRTDH